MLGIEITAITAFGGTTLVLGESELGVDWELRPSDRFARHAFDVVVDVPLSDTEQRQIRAIVDYLKPVHTLAAARQAARARRLAENRAVTCETCAATSEPTTALENAA